MTFIQNDDVISTFSPNTSIESFNIGILPGATICGLYLLDTHGLNAPLENPTGGTLHVIGRGRLRITDPDVMQKMLLPIQSHQTQKKGPGYLPFAEATRA
jgi:hypothetical protein